MTVWRDLPEQAEQLGGRRRWQPVRGLGIEVPNGLSKGIKEDGLYPLAQGKKQAALIAVGLGKGQPVAIGQVDESDPWAVCRWLEPWGQRLGGV
jgi:hypothetical protein